MAQNSEFWTDLKDFLTYLELPVPDGASGMNRFPCSFPVILHLKSEKATRAIRFCAKSWPSERRTKSSPASGTTVGIRKRREGASHHGNYEGRVLVVATKGMQPAFAGSASATTSRYSPIPDSRATRPLAFNAYRHPRSDFFPATDDAFRGGIRTRIGSSSGTLPSRRSAFIPACPVTLPEDSPPERRISGALVCAAQKHP